MTDETVVEADGVRVTKSFDADGFPVPAVRFDVVSSRSEDTTLTITDEIPDEFDIDQIGFHPEYGSEHWTATGEGIVRFERSIEPNAEFTTVYGVRMSDDEEPSAFLDTPTVTVGDEAPATGIEDIVPPESSDIVRELAGGKRDSIPGLDDEEPAEAAVETAEASANEPLLDALHEDDGDIVDAEAVEAAVTETEDTEAEPATSEAEEPTVAEIAAGESTEASVIEGESDEDVTELAESPEATEAAPEPTPEPEAAPEPGPSPEPVTAADVAAELADQIRNGDIADDDLDVLRQELAPKRSNVQLEHLQTRVSEMEAYADALGAFIDENGDAKGLLDDLQSDVDSMQREFGALSATVDTMESSQRDLESSLSDVEEKLDRLDDVAERLDRVAGDLDALDERVAGVEESTDDIAALRTDIEDLREDVEEVTQWRNQLSDVFGG